MMRILTTLCVAMLLTGCTGWHTERLSPQDVITAKQPYEVRLTLPDGARVVLQEPRIAADSVVGVRDSRPTAYPLKNVARLETRRFSVGRTIALGLPAAAVAGLVIFCASSGCDYGSP
jgi:hypothetical protein